MNWIVNWFISETDVIEYLQDHQDPDSIIKKSFKGYHIAKIRKDAGKPKKSRPLKGMVNNLE